MTTALSACLWLSLAASPLAFAIDSGHTEIVAITAPEGLLAAASHGHVLEAKQPVGTVQMNPAEPESLQVSVEVNPNFFINDDPAAVKRHGVKNDLSNTDREKVARNARSPQQLDASKFSRITFRSTRATKRPDGSLLLTGTLSIKGVPVEIQAPITYTVTPERFTGETEFAIKQTAFGITPFSIGLGTVKNADQVLIRVKLAANTTPAVPTGGRDGG